MHAKDRPAITAHDIPDRIDVGTYRALLAGGVAAKPRRRRHEEEDLHRACAELALLLISRHGILRWLHHSPNGGKRPRGEGGKLKALGTKAGYPDFTLPRRCGRWTGLAVELKSRDGRLSSDQSEWLEAFEQEGYLIAVCRTLEHFDAVLRQFLAG